MVSIGAMAYSTNGEFNSFGVKCIEDNDNLVQKIVLQEAGDFADFVANGNFNANFNSSTSMLVCGLRLAFVVALFHSILVNGLIIAPNSCPL